MGICSRRHFLLTICSLQLLTTIERQVFDFLGFMWAPILVNFFNIIFVILGFFGAFQYRPKYIISYCVWNTIWLGWNVFAICFYLDVGILDKEGDFLNFGTGSFSWWQVNGPGCKTVNEITEPEIYRPSRPTNVTDCVLSYEVIEVLHASTQCILGLMAIVGGICLSRVFLEEDDSFDFVGGGDFGLAGHTPLHPMYVSYSALPPPAYPSINSNQSYLRGTSSSHQSIYRETTLPKSSGEKPFESAHRIRPPFKNETSRSNKSNVSSRCIVENVEYPNDYSNPLDHLHRPLSPGDDYDSLESAARLKYQKNIMQHTSARYSPVVSPKMRRARLSPTKQSNRNSSYKPRVFTDYVRQQPLRSFYSDPRLSMEQQANGEDKNQTNRDSRPLSLYVQIKKRKKQQRPLYSIEYSQPEPPIQDDSVSPKPMTPRRVKRRSVISRDGTRRSSRRSSVRQSRRKNPVNRIMEQQESLYANTMPAPLTNQNVNTLSQTTLNYDRIASTWDRDRNSNWQPEAVNMAVSSPTLWTPDPNYSNTANFINQNPPNWEPSVVGGASGSTRNLTDNWQNNELNPMQWQGQSNPTFQQTSTQSLNGEDMDDLYGNRPASARSSYSNYHGVRATPQVPNRTDIVRQSQRQFVLSGPPAYQDTVI